MKIIIQCVTALCVSALLAVPAFAAEKNCCEDAKAKGKTCPHKCCIAAKKEGKSCEKCNPKKKDDAKKTEAPNK